MDRINIPQGIRAGSAAPSTSFETPHYPFKIEEVYMGQSAAKQQPEKQYSWARYDKLKQAKECTGKELLIQYGRAVSSSREAPLFKGEPTMCRCCPKSDHIFLPNFTSSIAAFKLSKLVSLMEDAQTDEDKHEIIVRAFESWNTSVSYEVFTESLKNAYIHNQNREKIVRFECRRSEPLVSKRQTIMSGLVYDERMVAHEDIPGCEIGERIVSIYKRLQTEGLVSKCVNVAAREATTTELLRVHTRKHIDEIDRLESMADDEIKEFESKLNSIKLNQQTPLAARLAAGGLIELCLKVSVTNELDNGFAIIRPPGHHCESCLPFGFCLYSNVSIAIRAIHERKAETKVMVVDWDVHHGNSTQHQFWHDERVLYFSMHRYDNGHMFPGAACADLDRTGAEDAAGYNCNIPFSDYADTIGDKEYMYAWEQVLIPMAKSFQPDLIIVSCGFDSARGDPLGGFDLTPTCYGHMTRILQNLVEGGKVVLALEGGYNLSSISASGAACVRALLGEKLPVLEMDGIVDNASVRIIDDCRHIHQNYLLKDSVSKTTKGSIGNNFAPKFSQETGSGSDDQICTKLGIISTDNSKKVPLPIDDDGGLNMLGYQIQPLKKCKHTNTASENPQVQLTTDNLLKCSVENCEFGTTEGGDDLQNNDNGLKNMWLCVTCLKTFCGRSLNAHGIKHAQDTKHFVLLGYDDLSCWCYGASDGCLGGCDNYVDPLAIEKLRPVFNWLHRKKFGVNASFPKSLCGRSNEEIGDEAIDSMAQEFCLTLEIASDDQTPDGVVESKK